MIPSESFSDAEEDERSVEFDLIWLLGQVHAFFGQGMQRELEHSPISVDGLWFLAILDMLDNNATPRQLAQWMVRKQNTISSMTKRLEEKGFVKKRRVTGSNNRVYLRIMLTQKGKRFLESRRGAALVSEALSSFSSEEKRQFRSLLFKARESVARKVKDYEEPPFPSAIKPSPYRAILLRR